MTDIAELRVDTIMSRDVHGVAVDVDAEAAWHHMRRAGVRHLVVLGDRDAVVGVLSSRDFVGYDMLGLARRRVGDLMTENALVGSPELTVREVAKRMRDHVIGCLPIVADGKVVGILTTHDLLTLLVGDAPPAPTDQVEHGGRILR